SALGAARSVTGATAAGASSPAHPCSRTPSSAGGGAFAASSRKAWIASHFHRRALVLIFSRLSSKADDAPRRRGGHRGGTDGSEDESDGRAAAVVPFVLPHLFPL